MAQVFVALAGFSFSTGQTGGSKETSPCGTVLSWGRGNAGSVWRFSYLPMWSVLVSEVQTVPLASPSSARILSLVSCSTIDVSCFPYGGGRGANNLCHHLGDVMLHTCKGFMGQRRNCKKNY